MKFRDIVELFRDWSSSSSRLVFTELLGKLAHKSPLKISICELLAHPSQYAGISVVMTVRITATKEGASLWDPACTKVGLRLHSDPATSSDPAMLELDRVLNEHGLSDHPVIATLTGEFRQNHYDDIRHQAKAVFNAVAASDIRQSQSIEHRK